MQLKTRNLLDRSFSTLCGLSIVFMAVVLVILLYPIFVRGIGAVFFTGTIEHRQMLLDTFSRGNRTEIEKEAASARKAREPIYAAMKAFEKQLPDLDNRRELKDEYGEFKDILHELLGPIPGGEEPVLMRMTYGQNRWDRAEVKMFHLVNQEYWDYSGPDGVGVQKFRPRRDVFEGTELEVAFDHLNEKELEKMLLPSFTFYWGFFTDPSHDAHFFGGIWPEILGTLCLTVGAMVFAIPMGIIAAIYLAEYAGDGRIISILRTCISTLAGVPSIVFGLFGLAFFINTIKVTESKSVLAGSLTLSLLVLPTIIRSAEEAIRAVPHSYKEAAMGLGASRWYTVVTVILPAALPGILTGIVICMGRAAGETAPIIFTAAVSMGNTLGITELFTHDTPALPWNIYNLCSEHEAIDEIRHVQYGMVLTLVTLVLLLNGAAIYLRARVYKKLRG